MMKNDAKIVNFIGYVSKGVFNFGLVSIIICEEVIAHCNSIDFVDDDA